NVPITALHTRSLHVALPSLPPHSASGIGGNSSMIFPFLSRDAVDARPRALRTMMTTVAGCGTSPGRRAGDRVPGGNGGGAVRREDAELVALGIRQARPRDVTLTDVEVGGAEGTQTGPLGGGVVPGARQQVEMDTVRRGLPGRCAEELQVRTGVRGRPEHRPVV